jgi:hypothetical protein
MKNLIISDKTMQEAFDAKHFLLWHPAIGEYFDNRLFSYYLMRVCKNGEDEHSKNFIQIRYDQKRANPFKAEFKKKYKAKELEETPVFCTLDKKYKEVYGKEWEYDHVEYWWDLCFIVYEGSLARNSKDYLNPIKWGAFQLTHGTSLSFEQCLINAAKEAKESLGDFTDNEFYTKEEKDNHKNTKIFLPDSKGKNGYVRWNPKWINVNHGILNRRWLKWFKDTPYCTKNWDKRFNKFRFDSFNIEEKK